MQRNQNPRTHMQSFPYILEFDQSALPSAVSDSQLPDRQVTQRWLASNRARIDQALTTEGAVLLRGLPVSSAEDFDEVTRSFDLPPFTYEESLSNAVRVNLTDRVFTANEAPNDVEIFLHHEMAQTPLSPATLFFFCHTAATKGGQTPLCRSDLLFGHLQSHQPDWASAFEAKGLKYSNVMPAEDDPASGQGRSWRSTLSVSSKAQAQARLDKLGYVYEWLPDDSLKTTTPVLPAVKTLADGRKTFFNQLIAAYLGWAGVKDDPSRSLCFGDDSAIPAELLNDIADAAPQFTVDLAWQAGDVAIVNNHLVMHGRRPYSGDAKRLVLVALAA